MAELTPREVKCCYEWVIPNLGRKLCSPSFTSQTEDGVALEWNIGLNFNFRSKALRLFLKLVTDIEEELVVNYLFSIEGCKTGIMMLKSDVNSHNFNSGNAIAYANDTLHIKGYYTSSIKITWELSYSMKKGVFPELRKSFDRGEENCVTEENSKDEKSFRDASCGTTENYKDEKSLFQLSENLGHLLLDPKFADVTLRVKDKEFRSHKAILSAQSPIFAAIFEQEGSKEKLENGVEIQDLEPKTVEEMLKFIYTGRTTNLTKMAEELLIAADRYDLKVLKNMAEDELICSISRANAINLLLLADLHSALKLKTKVVNFVADNVEKLEETEKWKTVMEAYPRLLVPILSAVVKNCRRRPQEIG